MSAACSSACADEARRWRSRRGSCRSRRRRAPHPEADVHRRLVVARSCRVEPSARIGPMISAQARLDVHVDVFERAVEGEAAGLYLALHPVQALGDGVRVLLRDDPLLRQHGDVRDRARDVLRVESAVEVDGGVDCLHHRVGRCVEPAAPHAVRRVRCVRLGRRRPGRRLLACHESATPPLPRLVLQSPARIGAERRVLEPRARAWHPCTP